MRIGIDGRFWSESGVGRYVRNLVWQLQKIDHKNQYVLFINPKDYHQIASKKSNWKFVPADIHWHSIEEQIKFPQILNKENLDLVHFPYFSVPIFYNKPFVITIQDLILHHFVTGEATTKPLIIYQLKVLAYKFIIKKAARNAQKIITVSNATKQESIKHKQPQLFKKIQKQLKFFKKDAKYPSLRTHKLKGNLSNEWSISIEGNIRLVY